MKGVLVLDDKSCEVFNIFSLLKKLNGLSKRRVGQFGLNNLETIILFNINENESMTQKDLVEKLDAPKQTINSIVMGLRQRDLLTMVKNENDKRAKNMMLTDKGKEEITKITKYLSISDIERYDDLGKDKIKQLQRDLIDFINALENNMKKEELWKV